MSTYTQLLYHIIFSTKNREIVFKKDNREEMFKYIWGVIKNKKSHLYRINAESDHIHILTHIHPTVTLSDFVKSIKVSSSKWIKEKNIFNNFDGWQDGYGAFTCSINEKDLIVKYIMNQEEHHKKESSTDEFIRLLKEAGIKFEPKYLE